MKLNSSTWILVTLLTLGIGLSAFEGNAQAMTQDPIAAGAAANRQSVPTTALPNEVTSTIRTGQAAVQDSRNVINQVQGWLGNVRDFFADLPDTLGTIINGALGQYGVPDLEEVVNQVEKTDTSQEAGAALSEALETRQTGRGSYAIRTDLANQASRETATEVTSAATLSKTAQEQMAERARLTQQETQQNVQLGEESQSLDVTQQILQNLSQQTGLNSQVNERILQEAQQARVDRALGNALNAQQARELAAMTTIDRRQRISAGNDANQQAGLLALPGGYYLGSEAIAEAGFKSR